MDLKAMSEHFNVSTQAMAEFTRKYLDKINTDGIHAIEIQGQWAYDGDALKIIETMKGLLPVEMENCKITKYDGTEKDLPRLVDDLQIKLTATMAELTRTALSLVDAERRNSNQQLELGKLRERNRAQSEQIAKLEEQEKKLNKRYMDALQYQADLKAERSQLQEKLNRERNSSWFRRLFFRD